LPEETHVGDLVSLDVKVDVNLVTAQRVVALSVMG
jgi:hypothetical protein